MTDRDIAAPISDASELTRHATALVLDGIGVMIQGPSGAGKSRLAFALLQGAGCQPSRVAGQQTDADTALIGDDYIVLLAHPGDAHLTAGPATNLAGLIEVRGIGILGLPWRQTAPLHICVNLAPVETIERLPEPATVRLEGHTLASVHVPVGDLAHQIMLVRTAVGLVPR